jgi:hypothetical protein
MKTFTLLLLAFIALHTENINVKFSITILLLIIAIVYFMNNNNNDNNLKPN